MNPITAAVALTVATLCLSACTTARPTQAPLAPAPTQVAAPATSELGTPEAAQPPASASECASITLYPIGREGMIPVEIDLLEGVSIVSIAEGGRKQDWPASPDEGMLTHIRPGEVEIVGFGPSGACRTVFTAA